MGYSRGDFSRFEVIGDLSFDSVLDIGSGPCLLHSWLRSHGHEVRYEAFDIRSDALSHCDCHVHAALPAEPKFDLVCLFGVCDYSRAVDVDLSKASFADLLVRACYASSRYCVFTLTRDFSVSGTLSGRNGSSTVHHHLLEVISLASSLQIHSCMVKETPDGSEYAAICRVR